MVRWDLLLVVFLVGVFWAGVAGASGSEGFGEDLGSVGGGSRVQGSVGLTAGALVRGDGLRMHFGGRGDLLFGRGSPRDYGLGPYLEVLTGWDDISLGGGGSLLVPVHRYFPLVFSLGGYGRYCSGWEPGVSGQLFFGSRSYNYHGHYGMAVGMTLQGRVGMVEGGERALVVALQVDGEAFAIPVIMFVNLFREVAR